MKFNTIPNILLLALHPVYSQQKTPGINIDEKTQNVDLKAEIASGAKFFNEYWREATSADIYRGAYHKAILKGPFPDVQSNYFIQHGGRWRPGGKELPGAIELSSNCTGLPQDLVVNWIREFSDNYKAVNDIYPLIFTTTAWWTNCTKNSPDLAKTNLLWISNKGRAVGTLPAGWNKATLLQNSDNHDIFDGDSNILRRFADTPV